MGDSASQVYGREIHDGLGGYRAVWSPGTPVEIGAVGLLDGDIFEPGATSLVREGIPFTVETDSSQDAVDFMSSSGVEVPTKVKGEANRYQGPNLGDRYPSFDPVYDLRLSLAAGTATGSSLADELVGFENASGGFEDDVIVGSRATLAVRCELEWERMEKRF